MGWDPTGHDGTSRLVSAVMARLNALTRLRPPEAHPGLIGPHKPVAVKTATAGGLSFRSVD